MPPLEGVQHRRRLEHELRPVLGQVRGANGAWSDRPAGKADDLGAGGDDVRERFLETGKLVAIAERDEPRERDVLAGEHRARCLTEAKADDGPRNAQARELAERAPERRS